jgi:hypothetical protein
MKAGFGMRPRAKLPQRKILERGHLGKSRRPQPIGTTCRCFGVYDPYNKEGQSATKRSELFTSIRLSLVKLAFVHSATVAAFHLQFSGASFAFVARKLETSAGRNCSVQFRRFK